MISSRFATRLLAGLALILLVVAAGCSRHASSLTSPAGSSLGASARLAPFDAAGGRDYPAPSGLVPVSFGGSDFQVWPHTGALLDGVTSDPINLVFFGAADAIAIRNALLSVDGDRSAIGMPPAPPFNSRWTDTQGDVQSTYVDGQGWIGSVVQLSLGDFAPIRFHLRLFQGRTPLPNGEHWTLGAAHFEVLIPGTADHQPLSWERAEQIVAYDLGRSGLLSPDNPVGQTGAINPSPYRTIPAVIYNGLPDDLITFIDGPPKPVAADVPIKNDGMATVLHLAGRAPMAPGQSLHFSATYDQVVPRPLCSSGPYDYVHVTGPVVFDVQTTLDASGNYSYYANYKGKLTGVPMDVTQDPPVPAGEPFSAQVGEEQHGALSPDAWQVAADSRRIVPGPGGSQFVHSFLRVSTDGALRSEVDTRCR